MTNIVMLVKNRLRLTEQAIKSLYESTPQSEFSLILVDDCSDDFRVQRYLKQVSKIPNCTLIRIEKSNGVLARAKNLGVYWSEQTFGRGDWLYLSDNDVFFTKGWLSKMIEMAQVTEELGFRLWGGQIHPFHKAIEGRDFTFASESAHFVLDGPSWMMRWRTWDEFGPLDRTTASGVCQSEEYPFCEKIRKNLNFIGVINPHVVYHTGLTNSDGKDAPGRKEREAQMVPGVIYE